MTELWEPLRHNDRTSEQVREGDRTREEIGDGHVFRKKFNSQKVFPANTPRPPHTLTHKTLEVLRSTCFDYHVFHPRRQCTKFCSLTAVKGPYSVLIWAALLTLLGGWGWTAQKDISKSPIPTRNAPNSLFAGFLVSSCCSFKNPANEALLTLLRQVR